MNRYALQRISLFFQRFLLFFSLLPLLFTLAQQKAAWR
jgi:hypothetical protein